MSTPSSPQEDQSAAADRPADATTPSFLVLGRILRPHGVRGEMRLQVMTDYPERINQLAEVYVGRDPYDTATATSFRIAGVRRHRAQLLIKLEGVTSRDDADLYRSKLLLVPLSDAVPLEEGEYYLFQILGAEVVTTSGEVLGQISDILETGANDVLVVSGGAYGEVLLPDIPDVVVDVDLENTRVTVNLLPGLLPE